MKTCSWCSVSKPVEEFVKLGSGTKAHCLECNRRRQREQYAANPSRRLKAIARNVKNYRRRFQRFIEEFKSRPCTDCGGIFDSCAMDFDHVRGEKLFNVSMMLQQGCGQERILAEIAKCELVCANCHRVRTKNRRVAHPR